MKRATSIVWLLVLAAVCLGACRPTPVEQPTEPGSTAPSTEIPVESTHPEEVQYPDPFPAEAYAACVLGEETDTRDETIAIEEHEQTGDVYHIVYDNPMTPGALPVRCVYRYPALPSYSNENPEQEPVWFRGQERLYLFDTSGTDLPMPSADTLVAVTDPGIYGLLERAVFPLEFVSGGEEPFQLQLTVTFVVENREGQETTYVIYRDGSVTKNDQAAATKLPEPETAWLFAVKALHSYATQSVMPYGSAPDFLEPESLTVQVRKDGQEWELTPEASLQFLRLLSDLPEDTPEQYGFRSFVETNPETPSLGEPVLEFTLLQKDAQGESRALKTFLLSSGGKVGNKADYVFTYRSDVATMDRLIVDRWIISRGDFDVQAVLDFLEEPENQPG